MNAIPQYVLGHSDEELSRLEQQGAHLQESTRALFLRAGIAPGMRVLDFGSGSGDTALLAAELVGPNGQVHGVDRSLEAVAVATRRVSSRQLVNVHFTQGDERSLASLLQNGLFDAVVVRLVLLHQANPKDLVRHLAGCVREKGVLVFQEVDLDAKWWSTHPLPLLQRTWHWVDEVARRGGMSGGLARVICEGFEDAGVVEHHVLREGRVETGAQARSHAWMAGFTRSLMRSVEAMGIASAADAGLDTLEQRMREEAATSRAAFVPAYLLAAFGRLGTKRAAG